MMMARCKIYQKLSELSVGFHFLQNKAIVTINARTSEILTANDMAAELFSYSTQQLIGIKMSELFADTHKEKQEALVEQHIEASGAVVMVNGKVVGAHASIHVYLSVTINERAGPNTIGGVLVCSTSVTFLV